jgi:allophanate hydrolase subunit 2
MPIIMLWDAQVSGGYTKIANVITADHDLLGQTMPGETLRFEAVTLGEAKAALRQQEMRFEDLKRAVMG